MNSIFKQPTQPRSIAAEAAAVADELDRQAAANAPGPYSAAQGPRGLTKSGRAYFVGVRGPHGRMTTVAVPVQALDKLADRLGTPDAVRGAVGQAARNVVINGETIERGKFSRAVVSQLDASQDA